MSDEPIHCVTKEGVFSGWEHEYRKISLTIPQQTYPTLISCKCIAVLYFILVGNCNGETVGLAKYTNYNLTNLHLPHYKITILTLHLIFNKIIITQ